MLPEEVSPPDPFAHNAILCYAWGESDYPVARIVTTRAEVRQFLVDAWFGDESDPGLDEAMARFDADKDDGDAWDGSDTIYWEFEIGGVKLTKVYGAAYQRAALGVSPPAPVLRLSVELSPQDAKALSDYIAASRQPAPEPPECLRALRAALQYLQQGDRKWREAMCGSQEVADAVATIKAAEREILKRLQKPDTIQAAIDALATPSSDVARQPAGREPTPPEPWIPLSERRPIEGATVLAYWAPKGSGECWCVATYAAPTHWHNPENDEDDYREPSHWMALPAAPSVPAQEP